MESEVEVLDTLIGKEILACLLLKTGKELADLLEKYSLQDFVEERYDLYVDTLTDIYTGDDYHNGRFRQQVQRRLPEQMRFAIFS